MKSGFGIALQIDEAVHAVQVAHRVHALGQLFARKHVAGPHPEQGTHEGVGRLEKRDALEVNLAQMVLGAFLDVQVDIGVDARHPHQDQGKAEARAAAAHNLDGLVADLGLEVALVHVGHADVFFIVLELYNVVAPGEHVPKHGRGRRDAERPQVLHVPDDPVAIEIMVADDVDLADLYVGAFVDLERHFERGGRNLLDLRRDRGVIVPVLAEEFP